MGRLDFVLTALAFSSVVAACGPTGEERAPIAPANTSRLPSDVAPTVPTTVPTTIPTSSSASTQPSSENIDPTIVDTEDLVVGTGATAEIGKRVRMRYVGKLLDGTEFDRTLRRPFEFQLGAHEVIEGWDQGIPGMRVGGKRKIVIPPGLAYGARGSPPTIPPNATLVFEVELIDVL